MRVVFLCLYMGIQGQGLWAYGLRNADLKKERLCAAPYYSVMLAALYCTRGVCMGITRGKQVGTGGWP